MKSVGRLKGRGVAVGEEEQEAVLPQNRLNVAGRWSPFSGRG